MSDNRKCRLDEHVLKVSGNRPPLVGGGISLQGVVMGCSPSALLEHIHARDSATQAQHDAAKKNDNQQVTKKNSGQFFKLVKGE